MTITKDNIAALNLQFADYDLHKALRELNRLKAGRVVFSSSLGLEDQVVTDAIFSQDLPITVFTLDTGRLFQETYKVLDETQRKYAKSIQVISPDHQALESYASTEGVNALFQSTESRKRCCFIRKLEPLARGLEGADVWITGVRAQQSSHRAGMGLFEWDEARNLAKFNPLLKWSTKQLWEYIAENEVPFNELHKKGFPSIGCAPCTRAISVGEDERAGRWWWEQNGQQECGLHVRAVDLSALQSKSVRA